MKEAGTDFGGLDIAVANVSALAIPDDEESWSKGFQTDLMGTVRLVNVVEDSSSPVVRYEPGHPDADASGFVLYPNVNPVQEMVDLMGATRAYGLNSSAVQAEKGMIASAVDIARS